ncbi:hypothetical protein [Pontimicrobium sp. SW4]|uniref:Uncharacterized protein n=1 Tax=Pontimicrobium sp. SW4 TaxID=3153519 RepID=A0AAU7BPQ3_9FLAO
MNNQKINGKYLAAGIVAVMFTWLIHEFTHWLTSELLGYKTIMQLNVTYPIESETPIELHQAFISISGPIITIIQALVVFIILEKRDWNKYLYPFLFTAFYMRVLAGLMNFINANDEGRVSQYLGIGTFTLSIIVSGLLFFLVYKISKKYSLRWKFQLATYLIIMIVSSILILSDQFLEIRII